MTKIILKSVIGTLAASGVFLLLYGLLGYERTELLAFALLTGISIASLKSN